jgi:beta-lactamase regulating signal transducer with metallopeptidase domain
MSAWEIISEIARTILIMSITGSVIALFLFAIKPLIKNHIPKSIQCFLWVLVLIALLVPFSTFVSVPVSTPMASVQEILATNIKSTAERQEEFAQAKYNTPYEKLDELKQIDISYREIGQVNRSLNDALLHLVTMEGGIIFLIEIAHYFIFVFKLRRRRLPAKENETLLLYQLYDGKKAPRIFRNPLVPTPMLIGMFRPAIYLPDTEYTEVQLRNILLHELTHLRRHDVAVKWLAALTVRLHWFNPIAYLVRREIDRVCELACDEAVIKNLNNDGKQAYGDTLIAVASEKKLPKTVLSTCLNVGKVY